MIRIPGVLTIRIVAGRYGDFRVGRLITSIGEFAVKDAVLDQYLEGSYEGVFGVNRIYPTNYSAGGRMIIEVRAEIQTIALSNINPLEQVEPLVEQDPIEEDKAHAPASKPDPVTVVPTPVVKLTPEFDGQSQSTLDDFKTDPEPLDQQTAGDCETSNATSGVVPITVMAPLEPNSYEKDAKLFGLLWPLGDQIKLDATVDRNLFRQQRDRLKELGYSFKPVGQLWTKP